MQYEQSMTLSEWTSAETMKVHVEYLGNIDSNPRVGLFFIDIQGNRLLQLTGTTLSSGKATRAHCIRRYARLPEI